jgi:carboxylate-amine ligase
VEHAFGGENAFALGMEEELLLVDRETLALANVASRVVPRIGFAEGKLMYDVYEALAETASPVCANAAGAAHALDRMRDALRGAGATLLGAGIHPAGAFGDVQHVESERYEEIAASMRGLLRRTPTAALHVHVGMPDAETAIAACNRMRTWLPVLQGLAANSPFWHGQDSGFDTARAQLFRGYPRAHIPRWFASWDEYEALVEPWTAAGEMDDYTFLWWDVRPHPKLGTLEVRAMDAQARIGSVLGLGALVHGLAIACAEGPAGIADADVLPAEALTESSFRAGRDGLRATLLWEGRMRPLPELARLAIDVARPYLLDRDAEGALEEVERILREGNGADRVRAAAATGGIAGALALLRDETREPLGAVSRGPR